MAKSTTPKKKLALGLQGGGAHGAFTWGVLDRLLEEDDLEITAISGTSAGSMNAVMTAYGLMMDGAEGAKAMLLQYWLRISEMGKHSPIRPTAMDRLLRDGDMDFNPFYNFFFSLSQNFSPYELNPANINPLRDLLSELIDFKELNSKCGIGVYLGATNVRTTRLKVFELPFLSVDTMLASACLPNLFHAVVVEGEGYWDGGFICNPPLHPLIEKTKAQDIMVVQINPIVIDEIPHSRLEIVDRLNEVSFNSALMWEMRWIHSKNKMVRDGFNEGGKLREVYIHNISGDIALSHLGYSSKLNTTWEFLQDLKEIGRRYADSWVKENFAYIGKRSTCDVEATFL